MANNIDQPLVPVFDQLNTEEQFVEGLHRVVREVHAISNFSLRCILWTPRIVDEIIHALAGMTTLKEFQLHNVQANAIPSLVDVEVARIVEALSTHPTLEELDLRDCPLGSRSIHSIHQWMALDQCKLRDLSIDETFPDPLLLPLFVEGLPRNTSLKYLHFERPLERNNPRVNEEYDINLVLRNLWKLPNLRSLCLMGLTIADFVPLVENLSEAMAAHQHPLRSLLDLEFKRGTLQDNDLVVNSILLLLEVFPELGTLGHDILQALDDGILPSSVELQLDRNEYHGRLLRGADATPPLSVWPLAMAKANENATMLYEMLQGPAFAGRESW